MIRLLINENEENQRLDKFLKKYLNQAPLSRIYKMIRKDIKVNGKRVGIDTQLRSGDEIQLYLAEEELLSLRHERARQISPMKRQFLIAYEDPLMLGVVKPVGLLVHGDQTEKKNTLVNQVTGYLMEQGEYQPGKEKTFTPAAVNRLDRNTSGLVLFGKTSGAVQSLNQMIRERGYLDKYYLTIVWGELNHTLHLKSRMEKDQEKNRIAVLEEGAGEGKLMETIARPLSVRQGFTQVEVELITGRTHQIRAHLADAGYPIIGDEKYGDRSRNKLLAERFGLTSQFLHASRIRFRDALPPVAHLAGLEITAPLPRRLEKIKQELSL